MLTVTVKERGPKGYDGWTPVLALVQDNARVVLQVSNWTGGSNQKPPTGMYVGAAGFVLNIADATDLSANNGGSIPETVIEEIVRRVNTGLADAPLLPGGITTATTLMAVGEGGPWRVSEAQLRDYVAAIVPEPGGELPAPNPDWTGQGVFRFTAGTAEPVPGMVLIGVGSMQGLPAFGTPGAGSPTGAKVFVASYEATPGEVTYNILFLEADAEQNNNVNTWAGRTGKLVDAAGVIYWSGVFGDYGNPDNGSGAIAPNGRMLTAGTEYALVAAVPVVPELGKTGEGLAAIGDSITSEGHTGKWGHTAKLCYFGNQRLRYRTDFAVGGTKAEHGLNVQLPQVLAMNPRPRACQVNFGSNHLSLADVTQGIIHMRAIIAGLVEAKIQPILWTAPPRGDLPTSQQFIESWNLQIRAIQAETGYPLVDAWAALKNPSSYAIAPTTATYDGTHPTAQGCAIIGQYGANSMATWNINFDDPLVLPVVGNPGAGNLAPNPLFLQGSTAGVADGVQVPVGSPLVPTLIPATAPAVGNWQRLTLPGGTAGAGETPGLGAVDVNPGELYTFAIRIRASGDNVAAGRSYSGMFALYIAQENWSPVPVGATVFLLERPGLNEEDGIVYVRDVVMPPLAKHVSILGADASGSDVVPGQRYAEFAQMFIKKQ